MSRDLIFLPVLAQVALTLAVYVILIKAKIRAIKAGECDQARRPLYDDAFPEYVLKINNHLRNQFELPVLFYVVCGVVWALDAVNAFVLSAAGLFVLSRVVHAWIAMGSNYVPNRRRAFTVGWWILAAMLLFAAVRAVAAESVTWEFGKHAGLDAVMNAGEAAPIYSTQGANFIRTHFVVRGESEEDWIERFEVLNTRTADEPKTAKAWYEALHAADDPVCPSEWAVLAEEKRSVTFERRLPACGNRPPRVAYHRVLYGKVNVFAMSATVLGEPDESLRESWLAVLASATIRK